MEKFTITIELGNDGMRTNYDVAQALRDLAPRITRDGFEPGAEWRICDENGDCVGTASVD